jgi:hypothetical protein
MRRPQFSLKTIFVVTTLMAMALALWAALSRDTKTLLVVLVVGGSPAIAALACALKYAKHWND